MPALTDQMQEGTIVAWLVDDGASVSAGQDIVEIETDKATMACPCEEAGTIAQLVLVGETVPVGSVIARVGVSADDLPEVTPIRAHAEPASNETTNPQAAIARADGPATEELPSSERTRVPVKATPVARRSANLHGVALDGLTGSGPGGRIVKADVLEAAGLAPSAVPVLDASGHRAAEPEQLPAPARDEGPMDRRLITPTRLQQVVARRMLEATTTVPHFQVQTEVEIGPAVAFREQLKGVLDDDRPPSINDLIVKACALALPNHPLVNGSYEDGRYLLHDAAHLGVAVASEEGLVVATVRDAHVKSLGEIARESHSLAQRVRDGSATPNDLSPATFTVSNLGMFGMTAITAVINPPQAAILGVGAVRATLARAADGGIVDGKALTLTLSCDHRIVNGADGSRFLAEVRRILESPLRLAL